MGTETSIPLLLIDDDEDDYILTKDLLNGIPGKPYQLNWCDNYDQGKSEIICQNYKLYLINHRLGEHSGLELLREAIHSGSKTPIIILSGQGNREVDRQAMEAGAADYIVKGEITASQMEHTIRHVLERHRTSLELAEQEEKYRMLFEKSLDAIFISDEQHRFVEFNDSFLELMSIDHETAVRLSVKNLFHKDSKKKDFFELLEKKGNARDFQSELSHQTKTGVPCSVTYSPIRDVDGKILGYQGIVRDLTEYKQAERKMIQAQKMNLTGRMAKIIAHEVRNPLTNINLAREQLRELVNPESETDSELYFDIIRRNSDRITNLVTDLLNSSKPSELQLSDESLNNVLDAALVLAKDRLNLREITLDKDFDKKIPVFQADRDKLVIAFLNIIINGIEAMKPTKGKLSLKTSALDEHLELIIEDNGIGIPPAKLDELFDPFFTARKGGMGLGLTTSQNIIHSHGGTIDVESETNNGTRFIIRFKNNQGTD